MCFVDLRCTHICRVVSAPTPPEGQKYIIPEINRVMLRVFYDRNLQGDIKRAWVSTTFSACGAYFHDLGEVSKKPHYYPGAGTFIACAWDA